MSRIVLGLLHNYNTFVYSRFFNFNILHSFNNKPRVSLYATPLTIWSGSMAGRVLPKHNNRRSLGIAWTVLYVFVSRSSSGAAPVPWPADRQALRHHRPQLARRATQESRKSARACARINNWYSFRLASLSLWSLSFPPTFEWIYVGSTLEF